VKREPDCWLAGVGPLDAVPAVGLNEHVVPGAEHAGLGFVLEAQAGLTSQYRHPLGPVLIEPLAARSGVSRGNDTLQPRAASIHEEVEALVGQKAGEIREEILQRNLPRTIHYLLRYALACASSGRSVSAVRASAISYW
jgi:hypothetical protein